MSDVYKNGQKTVLRDGKTIYQKDGVLLIINPFDEKNGGTMFKPDNISKYVNKMIKDAGGVDFDF
ncbi:hypothetical protein [Marinicellulosiphila megalodicopiae]|uniref:hypothetical protein n=1 Tax=Marinicellulosiphila megalodicopiae TaxID=2724896 RepID=UPI003BAF28C7